MGNLVSILIPVYNAQAWLGETLACVTRQTWPHKEIIVVDDGSTDQSLHVARQFEGPTVKVIHQPNQGACVARNRALAEAQGDYIQFLDADDLMDPDKIEVQMRVLHEAPPGSVAACRWSRFYEHLGDGPHPPVPSEWLHHDPFDWLVAAQAGKAMMPPMGWLAPRCVVDKAGPWNEDLLKNQDGEYFARVLLKAHQITFCPSVAVYYRSGMETSVSARRTPEAHESLFDAAVSIMTHLRAREDSLRVRQACAEAFQQIAYGAYPEAMEVVEIAEAQVERLGGSNTRPSGSSLFEIVGRFLGWKPALWLRYQYGRLRYKSNR